MIEQQHAQKDPKIIPTCYNIKRCSKCGDTNKTAAFCLMCGMSICKECHQWI